MKNYAISGVCTKLHTEFFGRLPVGHLVDAGLYNSEEEAIGHGYKLLEKEFPRDKSWGNYHVIVVELTINTK